MKTTAMSEEKREGKAGRLIHARSCDGCRAFEYNSASMGAFGGALAYKCSLGFQQQKGVPKEPCRKPRTISDFADALRHQSIEPPTPQPAAMSDTPYPVEGIPLPVATIDLRTGELIEPKPSAPVAGDANSNARMIRWLKGRIKRLENEVARLQRDSHPPTDLLPVIQQEIAKALKPTPTCD